MAGGSRIREPPAIRWWLAYTGDYAPPSAGGTTPHSAIWRARADGSGKRLVVFLAQRRATEPSWSPDGRRLAFTAEYEVFRDGYPEQRFAICVARRDGTQIRKLRLGSSPTWSPDGRLIAFSSSGGAAIIRPDGTGFRPLPRAAVRG